MGGITMAIKSYKVEATTAVAVTLDNNDHDSNEVWSVIVDKARAQLIDQDMNDKTYVLKVVSEVTES
jgi:hypothetical protein